jgi:alkyl sulfatase BDS1-like metallo-beta-lactamase superfamily hydrolase
VVPKVGDKPVVAIIHTHSHVDHCGGIRTFVSDASKVKKFSRPKILLAPPSART